MPLTSSKISQSDNILHDGDTHSASEIGHGRSDSDWEGLNEIRALTGESAISMRRKPEPKRLFMVYLPRRFVRFAPDPSRSDPSWLSSLYAKRGTSSICLCKSSCSCRLSGNNNESVDEGWLYECDWMLQQVRLICATINQSITLSGNQSILQCDASITALGDASLLITPQVQWNSGNPFGFQLEIEMEMEIEMKTQWDSKLIVLNICIYTDISRC